MKSQDINSLNTCCYEHTLETLRNNFRTDKIEIKIPRSFMEREKKWQLVSKKHQVYTDIFFAATLALSMFTLLSLTV
ncbi:MAG: hypothetical protein ABI723_03805 [Bacteroidia bacterium]